MSEANRKYLSVCSGIEAATVAWHPLGWEPVGFSEIEKFPSSVLQHYYPDVPNFGDMNEFKRWPDTEFSLLVGGTPCQSFSVAGLRKGMEDPRGNLALTFCAILSRYSPKWFVWENVPGVLSSNEGRDFGAFIGAVVKLGYGIAYRVLDAQYHGVPQRRRRVFVVGYLGDWRRSAEVLFEPASLLRNPPPSRETRESVTDDVAKSIRGSSGGIDREDMHTIIPDVVGALSDGAHCGGGLSGGYGEAHDGLGIAEDQAGPQSASQVQAVAFAQNQREEVRLMDKAGALSSEPGMKQQTYVMQERAVSENPDTGPDGAGYREGAAYTLEARPVPQAVAFKPGSSADSYSIGAQEEVACTLEGGEGGNNRQAVAFTASDMSNKAAWEKPYAPTVDAQIPNDSSNIQKEIRQGMSVRRLTPLECERLQGFPDGYTDIPGASDSARYKALGNSMAVPVMRWIGERIK